jgi:hypothetical protein
MIERKNYRILNENMKNFFIISALGSIVIILAIIFFWIKRCLLKREKELKNINSIETNENTNNNNNIKNKKIKDNVAVFENKNELLNTRRKDLYYTLLALQAHQNSYPNRKQGLISIPFRFINKTVENADRFVRNYEYPNSSNLDFHNHPYFKNNFIALNDYSDSLKRNLEKQKK